MSAPFSDCLEAERLRERIYDCNPVGCCWHIVLDDGNLDDGCVEMCELLAARHCHADCINLGPLIRCMSQTQRKKLSSRGYANMQPTS